METLRVCSQGHKYHKSSDCQSCPVCEAERKPAYGFLSKLSAPARRAFENKNITTLIQLTQYSEVELLKLHGVGPGSLPKLRDALEAAGITFKKQ